MSRNLQSSGELCNAYPPLNIKWRLFKSMLAIFVTMVILLLFSVPVYAAIGGFLVVDTEGVYHQYDYDELLDSYALKIMGQSNGLYEDFAAKKAYALLSVVNGFLDYDTIVNRYAAAMVSGNKFDLAAYLESKTAVKAKLPAVIQVVSTGSGKLVRTEVATGQGQTPIPTGGSDEDDTSIPDTNTGTLIVAETSVTLKAAMNWAAKKNAHQRFIDIAALYWEYGKLTGIAPEVLYAQAALETGYGRYGGQVPAEFNNWAGIKIATSNGDKPEDHQQFATPEDGVRGHFNHIAAYVGLEPVGEPHGRYFVVLTTPWAGTVTTVEELSGKWAPSESYHERIINLIDEMVN